MILTYRYRLLPTKRQHRALEALLEAQRELYNAALEERIGAYEKAAVTRTYFDQTQALTEWRQSDSEARRVHVSIQRATLRRLDQAFKAFYRRVRAGGKPGFPRFRGQGWFDSFGLRLSTGISLEQNRIQFKGVPGTLRIHLHRPIPPGAVIKSCVFRRTVDGWHVALATESKEAPLRKQQSAVGVDLGLTTYAALSDGGFIPSLSAARRAQRRLRILNRKLARKKPGSRKRIKAVVALKRLHAGVVRQRNEHLHQASSRLVREYDIIAVEKLNVLALARGILAREVKDASWTRFISMLRYKAERAGVRLIEVDPQYTSQDCSGCGTTVPKSLSARIHHCSKCGLWIDRDLNAARNILDRAGVGPGLRNVAEEGCVQAETSVLGD